MATSAQTLVNRVRRMLRDWPDYDAITASVSNAAVTLAVADSTLYTPRWEVELDSELMFVRALPGGTSLTVKRGAKGSTAASHASGAAVLIRPRFYAVEMIDALNAGVNAAFPKIYKPVIDTSVATAESTYEFTIPNMPGTTTPIQRLSKVEVKLQGDLAYRDFGHWQIRRDATTPKLILKRPFAAGGTFKFHGFGTFPNLADTSSSLDAAFPAEAEELLVLYAAQYLLVSGEAGRVAQDVGATDTREQANRVGASMSAANGLYQRYQALMRTIAMPPLPRHAVSTM